MPSDGLIKRRAKLLIIKVQKTPSIHFQRLQDKNFSTPSYRCHFYYPSTRGGGKIGSEIWSDWKIGYKDRRCILSIKSKKPQRKLFKIVPVYDWFEIRLYPDGTCALKKIINVWYFLIFPIRHFWTITEFEQIEKEINEFLTHSVRWA